MRRVKENFEQKRADRRAAKSSSWVQFVIKIILFVAVLILIKNLSISADDSEQGILFEQTAPQENPEQNSGH